MKNSYMEAVSFYVNAIDNKFFSTNDELLEYLHSNYKFVIGNSEEDENSKKTILLINNFLLTYSEINNDLKEITERIKNIKEKIAHLNPESYECRKMKYFNARNIKAKEEIEEFLIYKLPEYVQERVSENKKWIRSPSELGRLFDVLPYDYSYYRRYYNESYDFSTVAKFSFLLNHNQEKINDKINLKREKREEYYNNINNLIESKDILKKVVLKVKCHHRLKERAEIFDTLYGLYNNELYQSFINLAVVQIEGLFYDFCVVINDEEESDNIGTLGEKAEKIFKSNLSLWLSIYPYFAFEAPIFRNKIAHSGLWNSDKLKDFANELILDFNTILELIELPYVPPNNLLILFVPMRKEIINLEFTKNDYETIHYNLFSSVQFSKDIFRLIKEREKKRTMLEHYKIPICDGVVTNLYEECNRISNVFNDQKFWDIILKLVKEIKEHEAGKPYDYIDFAKLITDNYIHFLKPGTLAKDKCIEIKMQLKNFGI